MSVPAYDFLVTPEIQAAFNKKSERERDFILAVLCSAKEKGWPVGLKIDDTGELCFTGIGLKGK